MKDDQTPKSFLQRQPTRIQQKGKPKNTLHKTYQRGLLNGNTSIQPNWVGVMAVAYLRDDWRLFDNVLVASKGTGVSKVKGKVPFCYNNF